MALDLSSLLQRPTGTAKRPPAWPFGIYPGIVKSFEFISKVFGKETPGIRFFVAATGWPENISSEEQEGIDLSKRTMRKDFSIAEDDIWILEAFLTSCGLADGHSSDEENIPKTVGCPVLIEVQQYVNQRTLEVGNQVGRLIGNVS